MRYFAFDTETHPFAPGLQQPPMVCMSFGDGRVMHRHDPALRREVERMYAGAERGEWVIGGLHTAFDLGEICVTWPDLMLRTFQLLDAGRITCALVRQKLMDIATGHYWRRNSRGCALIDGQVFEYNMEDLARRYRCPVQVNKENPWRTRYNELEHIPVSQWPEEARKYSSDDGIVTDWLLAEQDRVADPRWLVDQWNQMRHSFALQLVSAWGMRTDHPVVSAYAAQIKWRAERDEQRLFELGLIRPKKGGGFSVFQEAVQQYAARVYAERGIDPPMTEGGDPNNPKSKGKQIKVDEDSCDMLGDRLLSAVQAMRSAKSKRSKPEEMAEGLWAPIHTRFDSLMSTGRTSSSGPPMQNRPKEPGDRECVVPSRRGWVFGVHDYGGLELATHAQSCLCLLGRSRLAEVLNAGGDPHAMIAAQLLHIPLEEMMRRKADKGDTQAQNARQTGKIANFGLGGGLAWKALVQQARVEYKVHLTEREAKNLIALWKETWPEMNAYFAFNEDLCSGGVKGKKGGKATIVQLFSGRWRGNIPYTEVCNTWFQGLGADTAKTALYAVVRECYVGNGPLRGSRPVHFVHDEIVTEMPEEIAHEALHEQQRIMEGVASIWVPNVRLGVEGCLTRRWSKQAKEVKDKATGRVIPWELTREAAHKIKDDKGNIGAYDWLGEAVALSAGHAA